MARASVLLLSAAALAGVAWAQERPRDAGDPTISERPKIHRNSPLPDYPRESLRTFQEGEAKLNLCVDTSGRTTSYTLAKSSGHELLDRATLEWARIARFVPAKAGEQPVAVCNYILGYEWKIDPETKTIDYRDIARLGPQDRPRLITTGPEPGYPEAAIKDRAEGVVKVSLCIDATGKVVTISLMTPEAHDSLELATARWATTGTYLPGRIFGAATDVCGLVIERSWKLPN
jgi:TonB family protein